MKKHLLLLASFIALSPTVVFAQDNDEKINVLLEEIAVLEKEVETKKLEVQKLAYGDKEDAVEWKEMDLDISRDFLGTPTLVKIVKMGIDYSLPSPELIVIYYTKNISSEKFSPDIAIEGSLQIETDQELDWVNSKEYNTYLIKYGEDFIEGDKYSLPVKVAPGWEGYFRKSYPLENPTGVYHLVDGTLNGYRWKITILGTEEPFGTSVTPGE